MSGLAGMIGSVEQDNLIARVFPPVDVTGVLIAKGDEAAEYKRGTVMAQSTKDGKLYILGSTAASGDTLTPAYILTDDVEVGTDADAATTAYRTGCFNKEAVSVKEGYTMTDADVDALRKYGIVFVGEML